MQENDTVVLNDDVPEYGLQAGDIGTVVFVYEGGAGYEAEFVTPDGQTVAVVTLKPAQIRPIGPGEIPHARAVAGGRQ